METKMKKGIKMINNREDAIKQLQDEKVEKYWCMTVDEKGLFSSSANCTLGDAKKMMKSIASKEFYMKRMILEVAIEWLEECMEGSQNDK